MRRGEGCQVAIDAKLFCQTVGDFFYIFLKLDGCQAKIENCLSCCYTLSEPYKN
jgi:hypothetical protein